MSVFIIAEAGVNHNGSLQTAMQLVDAAVAAGADAVKFQTFKAEKLVTQSAAKADYQKHTTGAAESQLDMLRKLELKYEFHFQLRDYCQSQGIEFLSTAFDLDSLRFLVDELGISRLKIPSGEITNGPFLLAHAQAGKGVIVSTGMATLGEVEAALGVLAFGFLGWEQPSLAAFQQAYSTEAGQAVLKEKVTLLHCTSEYPTPMADVNLRAMDVLQHAFGLPVGYSDHTEGLVVPIAAVARGAVVIEKHFTLDRSQKGPDHQVSLEPAELKQMVWEIRTVEQALGRPGKMPQAVELQNRAVVRKSLVAATPIIAGEKLSAKNLTCKRPGTGLSPMDYWRLLGQISGRDYETDDLIE
ncbi:MULTISPECIES: N-acetylneuraminate synthase [Methylomonas]|uniref:N-acetylneuraminate synthase n=2 Tax=Methylomonas TaxID=416 RepID=A0A126T7N3_9GAMM|nr:MULTISPECIES: N-acetylneuraminate synthase [Methylomonas]AMK77764.1 N-acetylneuraminate synthase [Methylomonas denitrificans]OAI08654.1 N-acetylneuraminate synthase [Methylomonas methanica]TCV86937.1 N-acetylneuraminate synthase [Methylomonas methanica]